MEGHCGFHALEVILLWSPPTGGGDALVETLSELKPASKQLMFDLAEEAGLDMTDWRTSSNDPRGYKANPKYCYEWAYVVPGKCVILTLWHANLLEEEGKTFTKGNFRSHSERLRTMRHQSRAAARAQVFDTAIKAALSNNLPVRVIIVDGVMREDLPAGKPSTVRRRKLDAQPWAITSYNWGNGDYELTRGILTAPYVDQFDLDQAAKSVPERQDQTSSVFHRDPAVRERVKRRAMGLCELCGQAGFLTTGGALYLETHHVTALSEGGADDDRNVVALCAQDHRRAHFADDRAAIKVRLLEILAAGVIR
jgi:5-methylcytosine-specific restriction protein A